MEKTKTTSKYPSINKVINSLRTYIFISLTTYAYHPINKWSPQTYRSEKCINEYVQWLERHAKMIIIHNVADQTSELWSHRRHSVFFATGPLPDKGTNLIHEYGKWKAPDIINFCQYKLAHHRHTHTHTHTHLPTYNRTWHKPLPVRNLRRRWIAPTEHRSHSTLVSNQYKQIIIMPSKTGQVCTRQRYRVQFNFNSSSILFSSSASSTTNNKSRFQKHINLFMMAIHRIWKKYLNHLITTKYYVW